jgi:hypothetical protein
MKTVQIRHVPDDLHRRLKSKAALEGMSLSDFALAELRRAADRPSRAELLARIRSRRPVELTRSAASLVREERDSR